MGVFDTIGRFFLGDDNYDRVTTGKADSDLEREREQAEWIYQMTRQRATMDNSLQNANVNRIGIMGALAITGIVLVIVVVKRA